jgi:hypothetical protein
MFATSLQSSDYSCARPNRAGPLLFIVAGVKRSRALYQVRDKFAQIRLLLCASRQIHIWPQMIDVVEECWLDHVV